MVANEENLGLARSFNRALGTVTTDYVLTCHVDCRFGTDDYVARVVRPAGPRTPTSRVVSGQSIADVEAGLSQVEKVYLAANLMDVFPDGDERARAGRLRRGPLRRLPHGGPAPRRASTTPPCAAPARTR